MESRLVGEETFGRGGWLGRRPATTSAEGLRQADHRFASAPGDGYHSAMGDGKHCPGCEKDIGVWPVLWAGMPTWVRCPHCRARLSYGNSGLVVAVLFTFFLLLILGACYFARQHYTANAVRFYVLMAVVVIGAWLPVELLAAICLRRWGKLEKLL